MCPGQLCRARRTPTPTSILVSSYPKRHVLPPFSNSLSRRLREKEGGKGGLGEVLTDPFPLLPPVRSRGKSQVKGLSSNIQHCPQKTEATETSLKCETHLICHVLMRTFKTEIVGCPVVQLRVKVEPHPAPFAGFRSEEKPSYLSPPPLPDDCLHMCLALPLPSGEGKHRQECQPVSGTVSHIPLDLSALQLLFSLVN